MSLSLLTWKCREGDHCFLCHCYGQQWILESLIKMSSRQSISARTYVFPVDTPTTYRRQEIQEKCNFLMKFSHMNQGIAFTLISVKKSMDYIHKSWTFRYNSYFFLFQGSLSFIFYKASNETVPSIFRISKFQLNFSLNDSRKRKSKNRQLLTKVLSILCRKWNWKSFKCKEKYLV